MKDWPPGVSPETHFPPAPSGSYFPRPSWIRLDPALPFVPAESECLRTRFYRMALKRLNRTSLHGVYINYRYATEKEQHESFRQAAKDHEEETRALGRYA